MTEYRFVMVETRVYDVLYTVEADSLEEAREMAENGETERESDMKCREVLNRTIYKRLEDA